jgi:CDP-2,3-bis-(O-geranylgeranyl)-sn-glycerol synthase
MDRSVPNALACALFLIGAFVIAGLLHSAWLRSRVSRRLAIPLDGGRTLRGRRIFGDNKTLRGFVVMIPGAALSFAGLASLLSLVVGRPASEAAVPASLWQLSVSGYAALGAWAGIGFMVGELPNSFVKRQLGVLPGEAPASPSLAVLSFMIDRLDSILGMLIAVSLAVPTPWATWGWMLLLGPTVHWSFSLLLFRIGVKRRPA